MNNEKIDVTELEELSYYLNNESDSLLDSQQNQIDTDLNNVEIAEKEKQTISKPKPI